MHTLHLVNGSISYIKRSRTQPKIILTGYFNFDLQKSPTRQDSKVISSILCSQKELITDQSHIPQVFANFYSQKTAWKPYNHLYFDPNQILNLTQHAPHDLPPNVDDILQ